MPYILTFAASVILIAIGEKRKTKKQFIIFSIAALLIPCLLAAFRNENIGTDVLHYLKPMLEAAKNSTSFDAYMNSSWDSSIGILTVSQHEYGFSVLVYIIGKLTGSLPILQFVIEALILAPIYITLARNRKNAPVWFGMAVFYLLFFNGTLNLMRQWIAMALLMLAFALLLEKKLILTAVFSASALLFHDSAALFIPIFAVYGILYLLRNLQIPLKTKKGPFAIDLQTLAIGLIVAACFPLISNLPWVIDLLYKLNLPQFTFYLEGQPFELVWREILLRLPILLPFILFWKQWKSKTPAAAFYMTMLLLDVVFSQMVSVNPYSFRIGLFLAMYTVFALPSLYSSLRTNTQKGMTALFTIGYLLYYWHYLHAQLFLHQTYPYMSMH